MEAACRQACASCTSIVQYCTLSWGKTAIHSLLFTLNCSDTEILIYEDIPWRYFLKTRAQSSYIKTLHGKQTHPCILDLQKRCPHASLSDEILISTIIETNYMNAMVNGLYGIYIASFKTFWLLKALYNACQIYPFNQTFIHWWQRVPSKVPPAKWEKYTHSHTCTQKPMARPSGSEDDPLFHLSYSSRYWIEHIAAIVETLFNK